MTQKTSTFFFGARLYDTLKWVAQILLPAIGTLYFALGASLHLPNVSEIVGTITAVDAFLGAILGLSAAAYNKSEAEYDGDMIIHHEDGIPYKMDTTLREVENPADLIGQKKVTFKVHKMGGEAPMAKKRRASRMPRMHPQE